MAEAAHYRILLAAAEAIKGLRLSGIGVEHVWPRLIAAERNLTTANGLIVVAPWDREGMEGGNFEDDWTSYPVLVLFVLAKNQDLSLKEPEFGWREKVIGLFRGHNLPDVSEVWRITVEPQPVVDPRLFLDSQIMAGAVLFRFWTTKGRGA